MQSTIERKSRGNGKIRPALLRESGKRLLTPPRNEKPITIVGAGPADLDSVIGLPVAVGVSLSRKYLQDRRPIKQRRHSVIHNRAAQQVNSVGSVAGTVRAAEHRHCILRLSPKRIKYAHTGAPPSQQKRPRRIVFICSIFLRKFGAGEGIRTLDPNLGKVVLYP